MCAEYLLVKLLFKKCTKLLNFQLCFQIFSYVFKFSVMFSNFLQNWGRTSPSDFPCSIICKRREKNVTWHCQATVSYRVKAFKVCLRASTSKTFCQFYKKETGLIFSDRMTKIIFVCTADLLLERFQNRDF